MSMWMVDALSEHISILYGQQSEIVGIEQLPGGASKEIYQLTIRKGQNDQLLILRRAGGGSIYSETLSMNHEFQMLCAAFDAGVRVPKPVAFVPDIGGREAMLMKRLEGETQGRKLVALDDEKYSRLKDNLINQLATELAKIHEIKRDTLPFMPGASQEPAANSVIERLYTELDSISEPHPAIEWGLQWLAANPAPSHGLCVTHGDFRIGNFVISQTGLEGILDWEFAHIGDPVEDLAWPMVRAWRFGRDERRFGGMGSAEAFLESYNLMTRRNVAMSTLLYWEIMGNVKWAVGALAQARRHLGGESNDIELAVLGRLAAESEMEILHLIKNY
jgi:aminoglycoside phosphotransferase (APT) family kinase protein